MAIIIPFKTRQQLGIENAVKVMSEWEAHWNHVIVRETEEQALSREEIEWLNEWVGEEK